MYICLTKIKKHLTVYLNKLKVKVKVLVKAAVPVLVLVKVAVKEAVKEKQKKIKNYGDYFKECKVFDNK